MSDLVEILSVGRLNICHGDKSANQLPAFRMWGKRMQG